MISLLILTQNRRGVTARCLRSLTSTLKRDDVEWRILDNGSRDGLAEWLLNMAAHYPGQVHITLRADNTGVAGGRQLLLDQAQGDVLVFLDNDAEAISAQWLDALIDPLSQTEIGLCGPAGHWVVENWNWYQAVEPGYTGHVDTVSGYCQAFRRDALDGFKMDMTFNPYWHEDTDMCMWLRSHGYSIWCTGDIGVRHVYAGTGDTGDGQPKQQYLASKWRGQGLIRAEREEVAVHG